MSSISSQGSSFHAAANAPALPWRRANVRHTSNELYVDVVETLSVTLAPSGRTLAAFANGTIAFTAKISGVPDLLLTLAAPGGKHTIDRHMELPVFHPCVRLARWREHPGELSFVPPDGRFILAGYEVNLLPPMSETMSKGAMHPKLPVNVDVKTGLGAAGADFEVRLLTSNITGPSANNTSLSSLSSSSARGSLGRLASNSPAFGSASSSPIVEDLVVTVPISGDVRTLIDIRASRGDARYNPGDAVLEWHISAKDVSSISSAGATLRCTVVGSQVDTDNETEGNGFSFERAGEYDYDENAYQAGGENAVDGRLSAIKDGKSDETRDLRRVALNATLMPTATTVSFSVKGWLASGLRVESLVVDTRKSRGLGEGVKPYKGVKYLTVSRHGVEIRC